MSKSLLLITMLLIGITCTAAEVNDFPKGTVKSHALTSSALADNLIGLDPVRKIRVYLPPGYDGNRRRYPVVYYVPTGEQLLNEHHVTELFDHAIAEKRIGKFLLVTGDFGVPNALNFFGNGPTTGRWLDHISEELVPFIDNQYRTLRKPEGRGISGHFLGGYAALKLAMFRPDMFGSVYALHPVATDTGERTMLYVPDWKEIHAAQSFSDLQAPYSNPFVAMAQSHLPNPDNPPFYADFIVEEINGELIPNQSHIRKLRRAFHLADMVPDQAENLRQLRGIKFDWGRNDATPAHVYGARKLSLLLEDYGITHEAEEHGGNGWNYDFSKEGHFYWRLLPFFNRHLATE